jgi:hypothetical protein
VYRRTIGAVMKKQTQCLWCDSNMLSYIITGREYHFTPIGVKLCANASGELFKDEHDQPLTEDACPFCDLKMPKHQHEGRTHHWVKLGKNEVRKRCGLLNMLPVLKLQE